MATKPKPSMMTPAITKMMKKLRADLKDAKKKLTVHQEPRSEFSAGLRSLMDQPRKKLPKSPHKDKKKSKYAGIFKKVPGGTKRPKGKT